jgi:uncharacterized repeat protein (TIGR03803 family)
LYGTTFGSLNAPSGKNCSKGCGNQYNFIGGNLATQHFFTAGTDGAFPTGEVAVQNGTIYGTTEFGGATACGGLGCGTAFLLSVSDGSEKVYAFCTITFPVCPHGALPHAGPILDGDGNAYGTTSLGGTGNGYECGSSFEGCGTVYMLTDRHETVLYSFCSLPQCQDGAVPLGRLWRDTTTGNLYGTTQFGGDYGAGTIFELQLSNGTYSYQVLYSFCPDNATNCSQEGSVPEAGLIADDAGNLYGTASAGGGGNCQGSAPGCGVVFKLAVDGTYSILHAFAGGSDGALPQAPLVADGAGNLYGTTLKGGGGQYCSPKTGCGTVFKLAADGTETLLYVFGHTSESNSDGSQPEGTLLLKKGNLFGATRVHGDSTCECGTLFKISITAAMPRGFWRAHGLPPHWVGGPKPTPEADALRL